jgi:hypothetical protein
MDALPEAVRASARVEPNGEVAWSRADAGAAIGALADAGRVVLGLDVRTYGDDGSVFEVPWSDHSGSGVEEARIAALAALQRDDVPGDWVVVTW